MSSETIEVHGEEQRWLQPLLYAYVDSYAIQEWLLWLSSHIHQGTPA